MPLVSELLSVAMHKYPDRVAILDADTGEPTTFAEFQTLVADIVASFRDSGLQTGDRVGLLARNSVVWAASEAALAFAGLTLVPLNIYLSSYEVGWLLRDSGARGIIFDSFQAQKAKEAAAGAPNCTVHLLNEPTDCPTWGTPLLGVPDEGVARRNVDLDSQEVPGSVHRIMYTSATTGAPKGVPYPAEMFVQTMIGTLANQLHDLSQTDRLFVTTPLTHVAHGYFWPFFISGCTSIIQRRFDPSEFADVVSHNAATHAIMAPTLISDVVRQVDGSPKERELLTKSQLRAIWYAGSPIPDSIAIKATDVFGPILNQQYGLTEMSSGYPATGLTMLTAEWHESKRGSCGRPLLGVVLKVVGSDDRPLPTGKVGEVCMLLESAKGGYWNTDTVDGNYRDGWLYTGDLGYLDADGFLFLQDRRTDMIVSGGLNIFPTEVESVLLEDDAVQACAVVGFPDERWIEVSHAFVVLRPGTVREPSQLIEYVRSRIAHFKAPRQVYFVDELPVSTTGKLLRREVRAWLHRKSTLWAPTIITTGPTPLQEIRSGADQTGMNK